MSSVASQRFGGTERGHSNAAVLLTRDLEAASVIGVAPAPASDAFQRPAGPMVEPVDGVLAAPEPVGDLSGREATEMPQDDDLALELRELGQRLAQRATELSGLELGGAPSTTARSGSSQIGVRRRRWSMAMLWVMRSSQAEKGPRRCSLRSSGSPSSIRVNTCWTARHSAS